MNSGAPASTAPPDLSSLGMMVSQSEVSVSYCLAVKYLGAYFPAGAAAFSLRTAWCAISAACSGITCSTEPPAAPIASVLSTSRLEIPSVLTGSPLFASLQAALLGLFEQVVRGAPGQRHDGQRGIFVGIGNERRPIGDEDVLDVVRLTVAVEHAGFRIGAHARRADFVNDLSAGQNSKGIRTVDSGLGLIGAAHHLDDGLERFLHVLGLTQFVFAPLEMEAQDRNAPLIHTIGVKFAVCIRIRNHLAAPGKPNGCSVYLARAALQLQPVALFV